MLESDIQSFVQTETGWGNKIHALRNFNWELKRDSANKPLDLKLKVCPGREVIKHEQEYVSHEEESGRMTIDRERRSGHTEKWYTKRAKSHWAREKVCKVLELQDPWNHSLVSVFVRHHGWNSLRVHLRVLSLLWLCVSTYNMSPGLQLLLKGAQSLQPKGLAANVILETIPYPPMRQLVIKMDQWTILYIKNKIRYLNNSLSQVDFFNFYFVQGTLLP